jgi:hypothetical protein
MMCPAPADCLLLYTQTAHMAIVAAPARILCPRWMIDEISRRQTKR